MSEPSAPTRRLLAGSYGDERAAARPRPDVPRWFEPLHVRDPATARGLIADQVAAGAEIVLAPAWRTHHRALLLVGESRRAREWTAAAVRVAREGVESGLERRSSERAARQAELGAGDARREAGLPEPMEPQVAGVLPALDEAQEPGSGRLLPRAAAAERDYVTQAGLLADSDVDLILVEGQRTRDETRVAVEAAASTGLPAWAASPTWLVARSEGWSELEAWSEAALLAGVSVLLATLGALDVDDERLLEMARSLDATQKPWGVSLMPWDEAHEGGVRGLVRAVIERGATIVGVADGAIPARLAVLRGVLDEIAATERAAVTRERARWGSLLASATRMTEGGAALLIGSWPDGALPSGFGWLAVAPSDVIALPRERYRLVVARATADEDLPLGELLADGGILLAAPPPGRLAAWERLRLLALDDTGDPPLAIYRRDPE